MSHNGVLQSHMATLCRTMRSTDMLYSAEVKRLQKYHFSAAQHAEQTGSTVSSTYAVHASAEHVPQYVFYITN